MCVFDIIIFNIYGFLYIRNLLGCEYLFVIVVKYYNWILLYNVLFCWILIIIFNFDLLIKSDSLKIVYNFCLIKKKFDNIDIIEN